MLRSSRYAGEPKRSYSSASAASSPRATAARTASSVESAIRDEDETDDAERVEQDDGDRVGAEPGPLSLRPEEQARHVDDREQDRERRQVHVARVRLWEDRAARDDRRGKEEHRQER